MGSSCPAFPGNAIVNTERDFPVAEIKSKTIVSKAVVFLYAHFYERLDCISIDGLHLAEFVCSFVDRAGIRRYREGCGIPLKQKISHSRSIDHGELQT